MFIMLWWISEHIFWQIHAEIQKDSYTLFLQLYVEKKQFNLILLMQKWPAFFC